MEIKFDIRDKFLKKIRSTIIGPLDKDEVLNVSQKQNIFMVIFLQLQSQMMIYQYQRQFQMQQNFHHLQLRKILKIIMMIVMNLKLHYSSLMNQVH